MGQGKGYAIYSGLQVNSLGTTARDNDNGIRRVSVDQCVRSVRFGAHPA